MLVINEQIQITEQLNRQTECLDTFSRSVFNVLPTCMFGGKGNSRGNASVSVGEGWPPRSITEVSGFKPQSALKRPQTKTSNRDQCQVGIFLVFFRRKRGRIYVVIMIYMEHINNNNNDR